MWRGIVNLILGGLFIVGGASGQLVFIGTQSSIAILAFGVVLVGLGVYRIVKARTAR
jgi:hypothetical protein